MNVTSTPTRLRDRPNLRVPVWLLLAVAVPPALSLRADVTLTTLHAFGVYTTTSGGTRPPSPLFLSGNTLFGTTWQGGTAGNGTIFAISLPSSAPEPTITPAAENVILTRPTNATSFMLQSTTNLAPRTLWTTSSPAPVVVNGLNTVTNLISRPQPFFRLSL